MRDYRQVIDSKGNLDLDALSRSGHVSYPWRIGEQTFWQAIRKVGTTTYLFEDGVVLVNCMYDRILTGSAASINIQQLPWSSLTGLDLRDGVVKLVSPQKTIEAGSLISEKRLGATWKNHLAELQLKGEIPAHIAVLLPEIKQQDRRGSNWLPLIIGLSILIGVPLFKGNGNLAVAIIPGLADITPSAIELAFRNNPKWPASTVLRLSAIEATVLATPTVALTSLVGLQQNTVSSLWYIPIYWVLTVGSREWQVRTLADMIADNENKSPTRQ